VKPGRGRILVVDDDPAMLRTVERILAPAHDVAGFTSGESALQAARREPFDVAIIDVRMPGMDGFELTRVIRAERPRTEVILVTGSVTDLDDKLVRSVRERAGFFITKPFSRMVLTTLVDRCLERQRLEEERNDLIARMTEDLDRARRFQGALLPKGLPRAYGPIRVAASWRPCQSVGGDLFDVAPLPDGRILLMVADVAGHGVAAALVTGMIKTALWRALQDQPALAPAARAVLDTLAPLGQQRIVTLFLATAEGPARTLRYLNAGHPPALLWRPGSESRRLGASTPLLSYGIGLHEDAEATVPFAPGDRLALYTDGLYEIRDPEGNEYGRDRLLRGLAGRAGAIEEIVTATMDEASRHAAGRPPDDDLTLLLAEFTGPPDRVSSRR
jgi:serine phosphatase RsbU (regulator of sigma subunit)